MCDEVHDAHDAHVDLYWEWVDAMQWEAEMKQMKADVAKWEDGYYNHPDGWGW
jgi:hypothetical protein